MPGGVKNAMLASPDISATEPSLALLKVMATAGVPVRSLNSSAGSVKPGAVVA